MEIEVKISWDFKPAIYKIPKCDIYYRPDYDFLTCELEVDDKGFIAMPRSTKKNNLIINKP